MTRMRGIFSDIFSMRLLSLWNGSPPQPKNLYLFRTEKLQYKTESPAVLSDVGVINSDEDNHDGQNMDVQKNTAGLKKIYAS